MKTKQAPSTKEYSLVISHYMVSAVCFVILSLMLLYAADDLGGHYFNPRLLAITHMAALGWGSLVIFGAAYQLIPVVFETHLYSIRLPWIAFVLFIGGLTLLVVSFWVFDPGILMQTGALLLVAAILLFAFTVFLTARSNAAPATIQQEFIVTSCIWLLLTAVLGCLLVFNFRYPFLSKDHLQFLKLHAHMGLGGWFLLLITGVSSKLVPMFLVSRKQNKRLLHWSYYLMNASLILFVADTYFWGLNLKTFLWGFMMFAGVIIYMAYLVICFKTRIKKPIDLPIANTIISFVMLLAAMISLPAILRFHLKSDPAAVHYTTLYGALLLMGWISALILGQAFKTMPFIVWVRKYENLAGKQTVPLPADLYKGGLLKFQTGAFILFCILFYSGLLFQNEMMIMAGIPFLVLTSVIYTLNLAIIFLHKNKVFTDERF